MSDTCEKVVYQAALSKNHYFASRGKTIKGRVLLKISKEVSFSFCHLCTDIFAEFCRKVMRLEDYCGIVSNMMLPFFCSQITQETTVGASQHTFKAESVYVFISKIAR